MQKPAPAKTELAVIQCPEEDDILIFLQVHLHSLRNGDRVVIYVEWAVVPNELSRQADDLIEVTPKDLVKEFLNLLLINNFAYSNIQLFVLLILFQKNLEYYTFFHNT